MSADPIDNEAELQAHLLARIRSALPLLSPAIRLERYLRLRIGHNVITVDGMNPRQRDAVSGRYDMLVLLEEKPLLLVELKATDVDIAEEDVEQVLSYARVHTPMVPLAMVTNGVTTRLLHTYNGQPLDPSAVESSRLTAVLSTSAMLASSASGEAVRALLGTSREVWSRLLEPLTQRIIGDMTGDLRDFSRPIASRFIIPRAAARNLADALAKGSRVLVLHGPPLSGVTNALAQFAQASGSAPVLFIEGSGVSDIMQHMANHLSRALSLGISSTDLRSWFNTLGDLGGLTLVLDGLPSSGLDELIDMANEERLRLVIGMGTETYNRAKVLNGRAQLSLLGRSSVEMEMVALSTDEMEAACDIIGESFHAMFYHGVEYSADLRWPRRLRVIAATLPEASAVPGIDLSDHIMLIPPIPTPEMLEECSNAFAPDPRVKHDLRALARAFLAESEAHIGDMSWILSNWGRPSVARSNLESALGETQIRRLEDQGFLSWMHTHSSEARMLIRAGELLSHHVADEWASRLANTADEVAMTDEVKRLAAMSTTIPQGDVTLAAAIYRATIQNELVLASALTYLINDRPTTNTLSEGTCVELLTADERRIRMRLGEGVETTAIGHMQSWLVLSYLFSMAIPVRMDGLERTFNYTIYEILGSSPFFIWQPRPSELSDVPGLHFHEIGGIGELPCWRMGIVEPLVQAMMLHMRISPDELVSLAEVALERKNPFLAWRLRAVADVMETCTDGVVQEAARLINQVLKDCWDEIFVGGQKCDDSQ